MGLPGAKKKQQKGNCSMDIVPVLQDEKVLEICCTTIYIKLTLLYYYLKMIKTVILIHIFDHNLKKRKHNSRPET